MMQHPTSTGEDIRQNGEGCERLSRKAVWLSREVLRGRFSPLGGLRPLQVTLTGHIKWVLAALGKVPMLPSGGAQPLQPLLPPARGEIDTGPEAPGRKSNADSESDSDSEPRNLNAITG
jgi:hypothetical protein